MAERLVRDFAPLQVTLFGSYGRGEGRPESDVDLLVVLPEVDDKREAAVAIQRALADIPVAKDVVVTTPGELRLRGSLVGSILRPALSEGRILYRRQGWQPDVASTDEQRLDDTRQWLRYASDDLQFAQATTADQERPARYVCYLAQQSAEKALKAVLVFEQVDFPRTHNVADLLALVPDAWARVRAAGDLSTLSSWAVQARCPDANRDATREEAAAALQQAERVWDAVSGEFVGRGLNAA
jgi:HEPN domain-containing protein/predicted nucleotidyltransferase